jgi:quinol monooxygenase YgiN
MYASVTTFELRGSIDQVLSLIREFLLPAARSQPGFVDLQVLTNPGLGRTFLISWWQTEAALQAAEVQSTYQQAFAQLSTLLTIPPVEDNYVVCLRG